MPYSFFRKLGLLFITLSIVILNGCHAKFMDVDDPELVAIREHILKAYYKRPEPINQCTQEHHNAAVRLYTRAVSAKEQEDMMLDIQTSIIKATDDFYIGIPETISALQSSKIQYMLYWEKLYLNSATYRNPLSGKTITLHTLFSPSTVITGNYTEPESGKQMELVNCFPFPKWVSKYYRNYVPRITRLQTDISKQSSRNLFVRMSDGIGGKFTELLKFSENKWLMQLYNSSI